jgi:MoaA/NifB/PqqE/SkfB family radical SAM enzyme
MLFNLLVHSKYVMYTFLCGGEVCVREDFSLLGCYAMSSGK